MGQSFNCAIKSSGEGQIQADSAAMLQICNNRCGSKRPDIGFYPWGDVKMTHESLALVTLRGVIRSCSSENSETDEKSVTQVPGTDIVLTSRPVNLVIDPRTGETGRAALSRE
jgi:hypothetical protein